MGMFGNSLISEGYLWTLKKKKENAIRSNQKFSSKSTFGVVKAHGF